MKNNELYRIWIDIENHQEIKKASLQRMVYVDLLYRAYIGSAGLPSKRFLSIEIPETETKQFDNFIAPQGFTITMSEPIVKHEGYVACMLQAASSDQNDVFAVLAEDILGDLRRKKDALQYISTLKRRIEKWREFFKNPVKEKLPDKTVIGLIGELTLMESLLKEGIGVIADIWNGPIKAAQDFQGNNVAIEVKTSGANSLDYVHITSEVQLDNSPYEELFMVAFRVERNDATGTTLPSLIRRVEALLPDQSKALFSAKLTCLGYSHEDAPRYDKGYSIKEQKVYIIKNEFPRLMKPALPQGITDINYKLHLQQCKEYESDSSVIIKALEEYEYGEGRGTC